MFAGGRVTRLAPLRTGREATRRTRLAGSVTREGRSGPLTFVTVDTEIRQDGVVAVREEQDLVYRAGPPPAPPAGQTSTVDGWAVDVDPVLLFRFSALTYNGHRIHYDRDYARSVEGYPGLVVHGPLQALLMAELVRRAGPVPTECGFTYRLVAPLFDDDGLVVAADPDGTGPGTHTLVRSAAGVRTAVGTLHRRR